MGEFFFYSFFSQFFLLNVNILVGFFDSVFLFCMGFGRCFFVCVCVGLLLVLGFFNHMHLAYRLTQVLRLWLPSLFEVSA